MQMNDLNIVQTCSELDLTSLPNESTVAIELIQAPSAPAFPNTNISNDWWLESVLVFIPALIIWALVFYLKKIRTQRFVNKGDTDRAVVARKPNFLPFPEWLPWFIAILSVFLAINHAYQTHRVKKFLEIAQDGYVNASFDSVSQKIESARNTRFLSPINLASFFSYRPAMLRPSFASMNEAVNVSQVLEIIERKHLEDLPQAISLLPSEVEQNLVITNQVKTAALTWLVKHHVEEGEFKQAFKVASVAYENGKPIEENIQNRLRTRYLFFMKGLSKGKAREVKDHLQVLQNSEGFLTDQQKVILTTYFAKVRGNQMIEQEVGVKTSADLLAVFRKAYDYATQLDYSYESTTCYLVVALDLHALNQLMEKQPKKALKTLVESETLLPNRQTVLDLRVQARLMWGRQELSGGKIDQAIEIMMPAYEEKPTPEIVESLTIAWQSKANKAVQLGDLDLAIAAYDNARSINPEDPHLPDQQAQLYMNRGERFFKNGEFDLGENDYQNAKRIAPHHAPYVDMIVNSVEQGKARLRQVNSLDDWLNVPSHQGMVPRDQNSDGIVDYFMLFQSGGSTPVAAAEANETGDISLLDDVGRVRSFIRDIDINGYYDERTDYSEDEKTELLVDIDADRRPDVFRLYQEGQPISEDALSGKVSLIMGAGAVKNASDFLWSKPDPYIKFFQKRNDRVYYIGQTDYVSDTPFPVWNEGFIIDFKYGDQIKLEAWDKDWKYDDPIDRVYITKYPESGDLIFDEGNVVVRVHVEPSELPPGHPVRLDNLPISDNVFRDRPLSVPEFATLISQVKAQEQSLELRDKAYLWVGVNVLIPMVFPAKNPILRFLRGKAIEIALDTLSDEL